MWPLSLQKLTFGSSFDGPIACVTWPSSLRHLTFGEAFHEPIDGIELPAFPLQLSFHHDFKPADGWSPVAAIASTSEASEIFEHPIQGSK